MKKIALLIIAISISLTSCNKDDEGGSSSDKIIGSWGQYKETYIEYDGAEVLDESYEVYYEVVTYKSDGTVKIENSQIGTYSGTWKSLGGDLYEFSAFGFTLNQRVEFRCTDNVYRAINLSGDSYAYYERVGYEHLNCDI
jgi:hypothetical protein